MKDRQCHQQIKQEICIKSLLGILNGWPTPKTEIKDSDFRKHREHNGNSVSGL